MVGLNHIWWSAWIGIRRQSNVQWKLIPKIDRTEFNNFREQINETRETHEGKILTDFKKMARPYLSEIPKDDWEWIAVAQHHGLATRLLDWTKNPFIALFFAVEEGKQDGVVWCYCCFSEASDDYSDPFKIHKILFFEPPHITSRIIVQSGCFTAHPSKGRLSKSNWQGSMVKIIIPAPEKWAIKDSLSEIGVHRASLFPSLDGVSNYINCTHAEPL